MTLTIAPTDAVPDLTFSLSARRPTRRLILEAEGVYMGAGPSAGPDTNTMEWKSPITFAALKRHARFSSWSCAEVKTTTYVAPVTTQCQRRQHATLTNTGSRTLICRRRRLPFRPGLAAGPRSGDSVRAYAPGCRTKRKGPDTTRLSVAVTDAGSPAVKRQREFHVVVRESETRPGHQSCLPVADQPSTRAARLR